MIYPFSWTEEPDTVKMTILLKVIYRANDSILNCQWPFSQNWNKNLKFSWKYRIPQIAKAILREKWSWRDQASWLKTILQSYSHHNSMVLTQKWNIHQWNNRKPRNKSMHLCSIDLWQRSQEYIIKERHFFNKLCWENRTDTCKKNGIRKFFNIMHINKLKMD